MAVDMQALRSHPDLVNHKLSVLLPPTRVANHPFSSIPMRYTCLYRKNTVFSTILGFTYPAGVLEIYPTNMGGTTVLIWSLALPSQCFHAHCCGKWNWGCLFAGSLALFIKTKDTMTLTQQPHKFLLKVLHKSIRLYYLSYLVISYTAQNFLNYR